MSNTPSDDVLFELIKEHFDLDKRPFDTVIDHKTGRFQDAARYRDFASAVLAKWGSPQPVVREPLTCEWTHNDDDGYWDTSCGKAWRFDDGGPKENNMNFCHCCGKTLRIKGGQHGTDT